MKTRRAATIRDVARKADVAVGTVSHFLNDSATISPAKRAAIEKAIASLHYRPDPVARSLSLGRKHIINLAAMLGARAYTAFFFSDILAGLSHAAVETGWTIHHIPLQWEDEAAWPARLLDQAGGTVILDDAATRAPWADIRRRRHPVVLLNASRKGVPSLEVDNFSGGRLAAEHLLALGHRRVAVFAGRVGIGRARLDGARSALDRKDVKAQYIHTDFSAPAAASLTRGLLSLDHNERPTAIFYATDWMARAGIAEIQKLGLRVPEDISVVGFDDCILAEEFTPALTTIRQPAYDMGHAAFELLFAAMHQKPARPRLFPVKLIVRESTAAAHF